MSNITISFFGSAGVTVNGKTHQFRSIKTLCLLAYLAVEANGIHQRRYLAELLWSGMDGQRALHNLRQAIYELSTFSRRVLPEATPLLLVTRTTVQFNTECGCRPDVALFAAATRDTRWEEAVAAYRGEFLEQINPDAGATFEEWLLMTREQYRRMAVEALEYAADRCEARADWTASEQYLRHLLSLEPWREDIHRRLMRLLAAQGQHGAALAQYENCRQQLANILGAGPSQRTRQLYDTLRADRAIGLHECQPSASPPTALVPNNLPTMMMPLIGRRAEMDYLRRCLNAPGSRLVTLVGPTGIGKTHLALAAAKELVQTACFPDGIYIVACEHLAKGPEAQAVSGRRASRIAKAMQAALALPEDSAYSCEQNLARYFRDRSMLLLLDGWPETLPGRRFLQAMLDAAPNLKVLVTAQKGLRLAGEMPIPVGGLASASFAVSAGRPASVCLFLQHATFARPGFTLTAENRTAVFDICRRVDGHPLALRRAAELLKTCSCAQVAALARRNPEILSARTGVTQLPSLSVFDGLQQKKYTALFNLFDKDDDGYITREDFSRYVVLLARLQNLDREQFRYQKAASEKFSWWTALHSNANKTDTGRVTLLEWLGHWASWHTLAAGNRQSMIALLEQGAETHFDAVDAKGNGRLSVAEFGVWLQSMGYVGDTATVFHRLNPDNDGVMTRADVRRYTREFHFSRNPDARGNLLYGPLSNRVS